MNIKKLANNKTKHKDQIESLRLVLYKWLGKESLGPVDG
jgi:hypothetical protein